MLRLNRNLFSSLRRSFCDSGGVICGPVVLVTLIAIGCGVKHAENKPWIEVTRIPDADIGGRPVLDAISGRVTGARAEDQIVLFARSGDWYVQPWIDQPFTKIQPDSTWSNSTHLGTEYAALLVAPGYVPPAVISQLPKEGGTVLAVATVDGTPPFWQRWWFRVLLVLLGLGGLLALYRWRLHELSRQLNVRFEERLAERTRIAQDLHDTLLQGVVSASMQLHVANEHLPDESPAKPIVGRVMQLMGQVIEEGRDAVRGLRSGPTVTDDLGTAFARIGEEFTIDHKTDYTVIVEGTPQQLHPIIRDEAYRIGREALANAFRHSRGSKIEIELEYAPKHLKILIRDDGAGVDPNVLQSGRDGHWGLTGMRERAESIGVSFVNVSVAVFAFLVAGCLLVGFMTPIVAIVIGVSAISLSFFGLQLPNQYLFDTSHTLVDVIALAAVILLLGPGAFSLDAKMFGRREIRIPSALSNPIPK